MATALIFITGSLDAGHIFRHSAFGFLHHKITMNMNLNSNLKFDEVMLRYVIMMALGITGGILHNYWFIMPVMLVFLTAILGWCPIKAYFQQKKVRKAKEENIVLTHRHAH